MPTQTPKNKRIYSKKKSTSSTMKTCFLQEDLKNMNNISRKRDKKKWLNKKIKAHQKTKNHLSLMLLREKCNKKKKNQ
jgi:hypothetical protein